VTSPDSDPHKIKLQFVTPVLLVFLIAALLVFIKVLPELPAIAETTEEFREEREVMEAPPLPDTDTSSVSITSPDIFEPEPEPPGEGENITPEELEPSGRSKTLAGIVDALIYILFAVIGGFGIYLLFKLRKRMTIKAMFGSLIGIVAVATCIFFGFMVYRMIAYRTDYLIDDSMLLGILLAVGIPIGIFISYSLFSNKVAAHIRNFALLLIGALMGSFLAALLPLYGVVPLVIAISLFDIYSVRRGPIKKIMKLVDGDDEVPSKVTVPVEKTDVKVQESAPAGSSSSGKVENAAEVGPKPKAPPKIPDYPDDDSDLMLMYEAPQWSIGIGDFVIYSMFAAFVLTHTMQFLPYYGFYTPEIGFVLPWLIFLITILAILAGFAFTIKMLSERSLMPGLPLAIALGLVSFFGSIVIMEIFNFITYGKFAPIV
jgi:hypothetical protein